MSHTLCFNGIYRFYYKTVYRTARWFGVPERDAEDVVQLVFLKLHRLFHQVDPNRELRPYLIALTISTARNFHTVRNRQDRLLQQWQPRSPASPEEDASHHERIEVAMGLVEHLDPDLRAVYIMAVLHEIPHAHIAGELGIPLSTVTARLRAAREQIEAAVERLRARKKLPAIWIGSEAFDRMNVPAASRQRVWQRISAPRRWTHSFAGVAAGVAILCGSIVPAAFHTSADRERSAGPPAAAAVAARSTSHSPAAPSGTAVVATRSPRTQAAGNAVLVSQHGGASSGLAASLAAAAGSVPGEQGPAGPAAEVVIIQQARQAILAGDLALARRELQRHRRLYPNGLLRRIREQLLAQIDSIR